MFLEKYLDEFYYKQILDNYEEWYLNTLDEAKFVSTYNLFSDYGFYYISDIVLNYLEIFTMDIDIIKNKIIEFNKKLGDNFVAIIGNDLTYLDQIIE